MNTVKGRMKKRKEKYRIPNNSVKLLDQPNLYLDFTIVLVSKYSLLHKAVRLLILFHDIEFGDRSGINKVINL